MVAEHKSLTIEDVQALGTVLVEIADLYPLAFRTERDFFPLVLAYLHGRVPSVATEVSTDNGDIDFRIGGTNPAVLELAVAPRVLADSNHAGQVFPGHQVATQLYASQNVPELKKLAAVPQTQAKNRYLLLVDFSAGVNTASLKAAYLNQLTKGSGHSAVRVVYARRGNTPQDFLIGGA